MVYSFHVCNKPGKEDRVSDKLKPENKEWIRLTAQGLNKEVEKTLSVIRRCDLSNMGYICVKDTLNTVFI